MNKVASYLLIWVILFTSGVVYAQSSTETPPPSPTATPIIVTLHLSVDRDSLILAIPNGQNINLTGFELRVLDAQKNILTFTLIDGFPVLELTSGIVEPGSCFVYQLTGTFPTPPSDCLVKGKVYNKDFRLSEVFWYDSVGNQKRDIAVYRDGNLVVVCPAAQPDCTIDWEILTPTPTPTITPTLPTPTPLPPGPNSPMVAPLAGTVNVRSEPGTGTSMVAVLHLGETAPITGKIECSGYTWWQILYNGQSGWVRGDVVSESGDQSLIQIINEECPHPLQRRNDLPSEWYPVKGWINPLNFTYMECQDKRALTLEVTFAGNGVKEQAGFSGIEPPPQGVDWSKHTKISMDYYIPGNFAFARGQIFIKTGSGWTWYQQDLTNLTIGQWSTLTALLRNMQNPDSGGVPDLTQVHEVGIKFFNDQVTATVDLCVANIRLG